VDEQFFGAPHKRRPTQIVQAQFALPFLVAAALVHGRVGITDVADIDNVRVLDVAARTAGVPGERHKSGVTVSLRDGRKASATVGQPLGSPDDRLSADQLAMKFADCARNAVRLVSDDRVRAAIQMIRHLEDVPDTGELLHHFI
jgi:2-methylcitrate dehydratase PrpD